MIEWSYRVLQAAASIHYLVFIAIGFGLVLQGALTGAALVWLLRMRKTPCAGFACFFSGMCVLLVESGLSLYSHYAHGIHAWEQVILQAGLPPAISILFFLSLYFFKVRLEAKVSRQPEQIRDLRDAYEKLFT